MSYILEALKKAETERQLGTLPTIHVLPLQGSAHGGAGVKKSQWLMPGLMTLVVLTLAALLWRQPALPPAPAPAPAAVSVALVQAPVVVPVALVPAAVPALPSVPARAIAAVPKVIPRPALASAPLVKKTEPAPGLIIASVAEEETILALRELPEPIQREIPPLAIGGYIYSRNPADRLLLIGKMLRHEGEELTPGLTLEKLQGKSAIFNYKGYRYRVPY